MASSSSRMLPWIVAFKAFKAATLTALGVILLFARGHDPVDLLLRAALAIHLPLTSDLFAKALTFAARLTVRRELALAITAFGYAVLMGTEGIGLHLRRRWARWFTIGATSSLIPIEIFEIVREPHAGRVLVLILNVAIVVYLLRRREIFE